VGRGARLTGSAEPNPESRQGLAARLSAFPCWGWLALALVAYFLASFAYSEFRALDFQTSTWDMGIYQQAIWSTSHGRPFYEAADYETGGFGTFLQVHSAYLLYGVVPIYGWWPDQGTLFAIQSAVVAAAAIPLYLLGRDVTGSDRLGLVSGVTYLAWAPTLGANLYDFHIESFLPIEIFAFVWLWNRGRYREGFLVAAVAFATMELTPVLLFAVGVFFLWPEGQDLRRLGRTLRAPGLWSSGLRSAYRWFVSSRRYLASAGLLLISLLAYYLGLLLRERYLSPLLGVPSFPTVDRGYVIGGNPGELGLLLQNLGTGLPTKVVTWVILLALLGFVPLLAPRALLLSVPWVAFTFLSANVNYVEIGWQYGFIEGAALLVAFVFGLNELARWWRKRPAPGGPPSPEPGNSLERGFGPFRRRLLRSRGSMGWIAGACLVALLLINVAASPIDPSLDNLRSLGGGYQLAIVGPAGYLEVQDLAGLIPRGAAVLASDNVFPFVANDLNAYSLFWQSNNGLLLPFNSTELPSFAFLSQSQTYAVPAWLSQSLYNQSEYGVRGIAWSTPAGAVMLFELGYRGATAEYSPPEVLDRTFSGARLGPQAGGASVPTRNTSFPEVVQSLPGTTGPIWSVALGDLPAGRYQLTLAVEAHPEDPTDPPTSQTPAFFLNGYSFANPDWIADTLDYGAVSGPTWVEVRLSASLSEPAIDVVLEPYLSGPSVLLDFEYLEIAPSS
jgi:uncharacterized membrane protein